MNDEAPVPPNSVGDDRADQRQPPPHETRNTWVALSIVEARAIAAEAMVIVAKSREICLWSQGGLTTDPASGEMVVATDEDPILSPSSPTGS